MLKTALIYGLALAAGALALQWLEYRWWARSHAGEVYVALIAFSFLALGVWVGTRLLLRRPPADRFTRNERALGSLGITDREYDVLRLLAAIRDYGRMARRHPFGRCRGRLSCRGIPARHTGEDLPCYAAS